jgi:hypothetical protein
VVYFDEKALDGSDFRALSIGNWVEYEEQYRGERTRAVKVRPIPNPKIAAAHCR